MVDCIVVTDQGLSFIDFSKQDLERIKRVSEEMCGNLLIEMTVHTEGGEARTYTIKPNWILLRMFVTNEGRRVIN